MLLSLSNKNRKDKYKALKELLRLSEILIQKSVGIDMPKEINRAILQTKNTSLKIEGTTIKVSKEPFVKANCSGYKGFSLKVSIE